MQSRVSSKLNLECLDNAFVSTTDIYRMYNIPASYIRRQAEAGNFPKPIQMGGKRSRMFWKFLEVQAYFDNKMLRAKEAKEND